MDKEQKHQEALSISKRLKLLEKRQNKLQNEILENQLKLDRVCPHLDFKTKNEYIHGSYYDREQFITRKICNVCNKEIDRKSKSGGYG